MTLRSERRKGVCWSCRKSYKLRSDGRVFRHRIDRGTYCPGAATFPLGSLRA